MVIPGLGAYYEQDVDSGPLTSQAVIYHPLSVF